MGKHKQRNHEVRYGVPVPPRVGGSGYWMRLAMSMKPGGYVVVDTRREQTCLLRVLRRLYGENYTSRKLEKGQGFGVWRLSKAQLKQLEATK